MSPLRIRKSRLEWCFLAEYQTRVLLGKSARERMICIGGASYTQREWICGCAALVTTEGRRAVQPCTDHYPYLCCVTEGDDVTYYDNIVRPVRFAFPVSGRRHNQQRHA